eukprot:15433889-Alexandrium_andersonii.AAC.1
MKTDAGAPEGQKRFDLVSVPSPPAFSCVPEHVEHAPPPESDPSHAFEAKLRRKKDLCAARILVRAKKAFAESVGHPLSPSCRFAF